MKKYKLALMLLFCLGADLANAGVCTPDNHPADCQIVVPPSDPWYTALVDWAKNNVSYSYSSTGWSGVWNVMCSNELCIKTYDSQSRNRDVFYVGENIQFDIPSKGLETKITDSKYGWNNKVLYQAGGWLYQVGWAYSGTYLDTSCHSKLAYFNSSSNGVSYINWYWVEQSCDSVGFKGYYGKPDYTEMTKYSYNTPGVYYVTALPFVYQGNSYGFPTSTKITINGAVKRIVVVDSSGCVYGQCLSQDQIYNTNSYAWLVPIISLVLN